jgi:hypothetical protein
VPFEAEATEVGMEAAADDEGDWNAISGVGAVRK